MALGQAMAGIFCATVLIPSLPEMVEYVTTKYPPEYEHEINNLSAGIFTAMLAFG